jgi:hypothetical protein
MQDPSVILRGNQPKSNFQKNSEAQKSQRELHQYFEARFIRTTVERLTQRTVKLIRWLKSRLESEHD